VLRRVSGPHGRHRYIICICEKDHLEDFSLVLSAVEQVPILDIERLQNLLRHCFSLLHQRSLLLAFGSLDILAGIMRLIDRNDDVGALFLEAQEEQMDRDELRLFPSRIGLRCLYEMQDVDRLVAAR
jgi:hypothetical protein